MVERRRTYDGENWVPIQNCKPPIHIDGFRFKVMQPPEALEYYISMYGYVPSYAYRKYTMSSPASLTFGYNGGSPYVHMYPTQFNYVDTNGAYKTSYVYEAYIDVYNQQTMRGVSINRCGVLEDDYVVYRKDDILEYYANDRYTTLVDNWFFINDFNNQQQIDTINTSGLVFEVLNPRSI